MANFSGRRQSSNIEDKRNAAPSNYAKGPEFNRLRNSVDEYQQRGRDHKYGKLNQELTGYYSLALRANNLRSYRDETTDMVQREFVNPYRANIGRDLARRDYGAFDSRSREGSYTSSRTPAPTGRTQSQTRPGYLDRSVSAPGRQGRISGSPSQSRFGPPTQGTLGDQGAGYMFGGSDVSKGTQSSGAKGTPGISGVNTGTPSRSNFSGSPSVSRGSTSVSNGSQSKGAKG